MKTLNSSHASKAVLLPFITMTSSDPSNLMVGLLFKPVLRYFGLLLFKFRFATAWYPFPLLSLQNPTKLLLAGTPEDPEAKP